MKKQLLALAGAAALGLGAVGANSAPSVDVEPTARAGYAVARYAFNAGPAGQAFAQGAGGAAGAAAGGTVAAVIGAKVGAKVGVVAGPVGIIVGAGLGAL